MNFQTEAHVALCKEWAAALPPVSPSLGEHTARQKTARQKPRVGRSAAFFTEAYTLDAHRFLKIATSETHAASQSIIKDPAELTFSDEAFLSRTCPRVARPSLGNADNTTREGSHFCGLETETR